MRVAFLVSSFPAVSESFILDQITGLLDRGCDVQIFAAQPRSPEPAHPEVELYKLMSRLHVSAMPQAYFDRPVAALRTAFDKRSALGRPALMSLNIFRYGPPAASLRLFFEAQMCGARAFDIVHAHFGPNGLRARMLKEIGALSGHLVTSFYGYDVSQYPRMRGRNCYKPLFAQEGLFLVLGSVMREQLIGLGCDEKRIEIHPVGVNPRRFVPSVQPDASNGPLRILTVARLVPKKGIEYGLQAVAELHRRGDSVAYTVIGDGPLRPDLEALVDRLEIRRCVRFAGGRPRPEVVRALGEADVLLAPSVTSTTGDQEGTPTVILEALASGVPVVSTRHAGIPEIVDDGVSGLLVPERDVEALCAALARLRDDPQLRASMGARGRSTVENRHNINALNDRLLQIYRKILDPNRIRRGEAGGCG